MGVFLFIDGRASVCGWVNFPILWPHIPVQTKLKCPLLWVFNHKRADFWLPNFGFKRSLLSLLKSLQNPETGHGFYNAIKLGCRKKKGKIWKRYISTLGEDKFTLLQQTDKEKTAEESTIDYNRSFLRCERLQ